jgi:hypothetical protein
LLLVIPLLLPLVKWGAPLCLCVCVPSRRRGVPELITQSHTQSHTHIHTHPHTSTHTSTHTPTPTLTPTHRVYGLTRRAAKAACCILALGSWTGWPVSVCVYVLGLMTDPPWGSGPMLASRCTHLEARHRRMGCTVATYGCYSCRRRLAAHAAGASARASVCVPESVGGALCAQIAASQV